MDKTKIKKLVKQYFGYNTAGLTEYVEENVLPLLHKSLFDSKTPELVQIRTGIKHKEVLNIMDDQIFLQAGGSCAAFTPSGATSFTQREIAVEPIVMEHDWCLDNLNEFWTQKLLKAGSYNEDLTPGELAEYIAGLLSEVLEVAYWQSDTDLNVLNFPNLSRFNGLIKMIDASTGVIDGNTGNETSITSSNVIAIIQRMLVVVPAGVKQKNDKILFMGWDTFEKLLFALQAQNNSYGFHYDASKPGMLEAGTITVMGSNTRVEAVHGLDGTDRLFLGRESNFFIGTDLENDPTNWQLWYDINTDKVKMRSKFKLGTQIAFPNEIVEYENAA